MTASWLIAVAGLCAQMVIWFLMLLLGAPKTDVQVFAVIASVCNAANFLYLHFKERRLRKLLDKD